jgi:hypothetical protein
VSRRRERRHDATLANPISLMFAGVIDGDTVAAAGGRKAARAKRVRK